MSTEAYRTALLPGTVYQVWQGERKSQKQTILGLSDDETRVIVEDEQGSRDEVPCWMVANMMLNWVGSPLAHPIVRMQDAKAEILSYPMSEDEMMSRLSN